MNFINKIFGNRESKNSTGWNCNNDSFYFASKIIQDLLYCNYKIHNNPTGNGCYQLLKDIYIYEPLFQKSADTLIQDTLISGWAYLNIEKEDKIELNKFLTDTEFKRELSTALLSERLYDGGILKIETNENDLSKPLSNREQILGVKAIGINDLSIIKNNYGNYTYNLNFASYNNTITSIDRSRMIFFRGKPYPIYNSTDRVNLSHDNYGIFSYSSISNLIPYFAQLILVNENLTRLTRTSSILVFNQQDNKHQGIGTNESVDISNQLKSILSQIDNNNSLLTQGEASLMRVEQNVIDNLIDLKNSILENIASAINIPLIKYKGQGSGGLNSSDNKQIELYASVISYVQENFLRNQILKYIRLLSNQLNFSDKVDIKFNPPFPPSPLEQEQIKQIKVQNLVSLLDASVLTRTDVRKEVIESGIVENIDYDNSDFDPSEADVSQLDDINMVRDEIKSLKQQYSDDSDNEKE